MNPANSNSEVLATLTAARRVANYALSLGAMTMPHAERAVCHHLGAVLADSILQAGLSYQSVVKGRVDRIVQLYPEAATLAGTTRFVERGCVAEFLLWNHPEKIGRFVRLVNVLVQHNVEDTYQLGLWLRHDNRRSALLAIDGVGPKTVDYLSCLVGVDCIAVDRHVRTFVNASGVRMSDYHRLQRMVSYAADLLGVSRRDFDSWIWRTASSTRIQPDKLALV